jgi:hypothetical protein
MNKKKVLLMMMNRQHGRKDRMKGRSDIFMVSPSSNPTV